MDDNQQFMPDTYKPEERKIKFRYYTGSLALEAGFAYLSCISALQGWKTVIKKIPFLPEQLAADLPFTFASIGTGIDFIVNISTISSANCANAYAILQKRLNELEKELSPTMKKLLPIIGFLQESSFYMGGAGNALWVFDVCKPLYSIHPALFYLPTILATAAIAKLGREYYWGFMAERYFESIIAFDKYLKTTSPNNDLYCNCMILLMALSVLLFRSFSFGGISVFLAKGLNPTGYDTPLIRWATFFASLYFTFATAISILFTRIKAIINFWSALQTQKQKNAGWKAVNLLKTLRSSTTAECLTMACGLLYISDFQNNTPTYMLASASALIIYISCMAQIRREICVQATRILTENGIDINTEENNNNTPAQTEQALETPLLAGNNDHLEANQALLSEEDQMFKNIQAVDRIFTSLRSPTQGVRFLVGAIVILCFFSVLTRGLSFLGFMDVLKMVFSAVIEFSAKNKIIIGLGLVLGPPNLKNLFLMFEENFVETTAQKYGVERQIAADNGKIPDSFCGKFGYYLGTLYQTGGWSFTAGQVRTTIDKEIEELGHKLD
ncbi:MAG: hypothetical protein LRY69_01850 [Gammaproteobacteria bacterium]|nr:hypothetical protein [Gammaproteobacteria bacterium]